VHGKESRIQGIAAEIKAKIAKDPKMPKIAKIV